MTDTGYDQLSRRERQIMDIIYKCGQATVAEVLESIPDPPSYSAVRAHLRILEEKGYLRHEDDGPRYVFKPTVSRDEAMRSAVQHLMRTFFKGSAEETMAAILDVTDEPMTDEAYERLLELIEKSRREEDAV